MKNKILVIEDDRAISELLCMNLEAAGYETVAAYDGEEAQRLLLWQTKLPKCFILSCSTGQGFPRKMRAGQIQMVMCSFALKFPSIFSI